MAINLVRRYPIVAFVALCLIPVHGILWVALAAGVSPESLQPLKLPFAILPTASAFLLSWLIGGSDEVNMLVKRTILPKTKMRFLIGSTAVFLVVGLAALGFRYLWDGYLPDASQFSPPLEALLLSPILFLFPGLAEEYGWRGFMQHRLQDRVTVLTASVFTGLVWGSWHTMDFLMGNWPGGGEFVAVFFAYIVGSSVIIGAFYFASGGSIVVAMLAHFSANAASEFLPIWHQAAGLRTALVFIALIWIVGIVLAIAVNKTDGLGKVFGRDDSAE